MAEPLFVFDKRNYRDCQTGFRGAANQEYYLGDYQIEPGSSIEVRADKKAVGSCSIIRVQAHARQFFKRSWSHIRQDGTDVTILWFVKRGRLCIGHQAGQSVAEAGDFTLTQSLAPFSMDCQGDDESVNEVLHVIVPTHVFRRFAPNARTGLTMAATSREFVIAERLLNDIFDDTGELSPQVEQLLLESALALIGEGLKGHATAPPRQSLTEQRLQDVLRFVDLHLSDPALSVAMVAHGCGISPRYLSLLLQLHGTPFSELVWNKRLKIASGWLVSPQQSDVPISEIAYRVGFKSPAHFSRMFKRVFKVGPREYRLSRRAEVPQPRETLVSSNLASVQ